MTVTIFLPPSWQLPNDFASYDAHTWATQYDIDHRVPGLHLAITSLCNDLITEVYEADGSIARAKIMRKLGAIAQRSCTVVDVYHLRIESCAWSVRFSALMAQIYATSPTKPRRMPPSGKQMASRCASLPSCGCHQRFRARHRDMGPPAPEKLLSNVSSSGSTRLRRPAFGFAFLL